MTPSRLTFLALAALGACVASWPASAHHSVLGFDGARAVTIRGTVGHVSWSYPHTYIAVDTAGEKRERWVIESESPVVLQRLGWTVELLRVGDRVWSLGAPAKDGARVMRCQFFVLPTGQRLPCYPSEAAVTPRTPASGPA